MNPLKQSTSSDSFSFCLPFAAPAIRMDEPFAKRTFAPSTKISSITLTPCRTASVGRRKTTPNSGIVNMPTLSSCAWAPSSHCSASRPCPNSPIMRTNCRALLARWKIGPVLCPTLRTKDGVAHRGPSQRPPLLQIVLPSSQRVVNMSICQRNICCRACVNNRVVRVATWTVLGIISAKLGKKVDDLFSVYL